jgi:response regulator of citrate/malate metabolism
LRFGEAARFHEAALQSLEAHGLKPLTADSIVAQINRKLADPKIGPNEYVAKSLNKIKESLKEWTNNKGVIDAWALDNIRKNTNHMVETLLPPGTDPATVKRVAALVTEQVRPLLIDAMEAAGGTGYRKYLEDYSKGMQSIGQSKLGAEMLRLYQTSPEEFVKFVEGNKPQEIEKIFGAGSYNIFKEMSANTQSRLGEISTAIKREGVIKEQASAGQRRLQDILEGSVGWWKKIPLLSGGIKGRTAAEIVTSLEQKVDKKTMDALTEAAKSAKNFDELLSKLPQDAKSDAMQALMSLSAQAGVVSGTQEKKKQPLGNLSPSFER